MERGQRGSNKKASKEIKEKTDVVAIPEFGSREVVAFENKEQYLFLLEFFIHHMTSERLAKLNQMFFVPTTISVEFLNFTGREGIEITPVDPMFHPQAGIADDIEYFFSGRSVMFAIDQYNVINKLFDLIVKVCVQKKMPEGVKPDVLVGSGELDLTKHFAALRKEMLQCWHKMAPPPKVFEGEVPLLYNDNVIGAVCMYVRVSAFGQTIVTEFEAPPERTVSSYVFKGDECNEKSVAYKCRIIDSQIMDVCRDSRDELLKSGPPCRVCIREQHPCTPCGDPTGATLKPNVSRKGIESKPASGLLAASRSKPETCADVHKSGLIQSSRGPVQPCGKAVVLKVSGILDTGQDKKPTVTVAAESDAPGPDTSDPDHDVFVLRIGKKGIVGVGEKSDIQLEMKTPKGPERGPPIRCETREMQTEEKKVKKKAKPKEKKEKKKK
ncbi:hypothetical protein HZU73_07089 [Apis mellifera caucasica]|uniref:Uncharacterized protein LOC102655422 n=1 Tax=Apis mellifera TaxID=7460 RepID=A0A7M7SS01_APIME|nr:uncharacterized protein LOC102655422 [Apis mellifera]KAG6797769.1 hypothetical protein HZU73_07089 [Apis mellifera caucasica]KAG9437621.1 hypothetical protein HZU67_00630 [Apis mellifera carnica]|eukprot:XP_026301633.1 uncharacterized protein LOC102655422 [Apis mellifera]